MYRRWSSVDVSIILTIFDRVHALWRVHRTSVTRDDKRDDSRRKRDQNGWRMCQSKILIRSRRIFKEHGYYGDSINILRDLYQIKEISEGKIWLLIYRWLNITRSLFYQNAFYNKNLRLRFGRTKKNWELRTIAHVTSIEEEPTGYLRLSGERSTR